MSTTTTTPLPYRHHQQLPAWVRPQDNDDAGSVWGSTAVDELAFRGTTRSAPSAARALATEWPLANTTPQARAQVHAWGLAEAHLDGFSSGGEVLDAIDGATADHQDQLLLALLRRSQAGDRFAIRTLLQAMMPKLCRLAHYADTADDIAGSDRGSIATDAFLTVVHGYPVERRTRSVAGNLALDTLHLITAERRRHTVAATTWDPQWLESALTDEEDITERPPASVDPTDEVRQLLTWAIEHAVITDADAALLRRSFLTATGRGHTATAKEFDLSPAAVRQRCSRAIRRIRAAVQDQLGSDELLDALTVDAA